MILLDATDVGVSLPTRSLFADVSVTLSSGDRMGLVGINGTGKSTLLRVLAGSLEPDSGTVRRGKSTRVVFMEQTDALPEGTARDAVVPVAAPGEDWEVDAVMDRLGLSPVAATPTTRLSGGEAKRVTLARALVAVGPGGGPDDDAVLLLLDEPTNHLDVDAIAWLEDRLAAHRGGLVLVTHDRHLLDRVTTRMLELDRGTGHVHEHGYAGYLEARADREAAAESAEAVRRNLARRELAWLRRGAKARSTKAKARVESATALVEARPQAPARREDLALHAQVPRLGDQVVDLHGVGHRFGPDAPWLFRDVDLLVAPNERLGIVGPNGAGKTTFLRVLAGTITPAEGRVVTGSTVELVLWDQKGADLDPAVRVRDAVAGTGQEAGWTHGVLMERFWFDETSQWSPIGTLSGGERRRLQLLLALARRPNVLLLDEPTNDLDIETLRSLEDFLEDWPGALVVVSHDRAFLERTVSDVLVIDEHHDAERVPGGYDAWFASRTSRVKGPNVKGSGAKGSPGKRSGRSGGSGPKGSGPDGGGSGSGGKSSADEPDTRSPLPDTAGGGRSSPARSPSTLRRLMAKAEKAVQSADRRRAEVTEELEAVAGTDHQKLAEVSRRLAEADAELAAAEDAWLELAAEAEG